MDDDENENNYKVRKIRWSTNSKGEIPMWNANCEKKPRRAQIEWWINRWNFLSLSLSSPSLLRHCDVGEKLLS